MRKKNTIDALFPKIRQGVLAATLLQPDRKWSMSELARHLHVTPSSLQRELESLVAAGILLREKDQNRTLFHPDSACPFLSELRSLMTKTSGLVDLLKSAICPLAKSISCAFIYGSFVRGEVESQSDIDLMVIGKIGLVELAPRLRQVERELSRPVNASVFSAKEFSAKRKAGDNFIVAVMSDKRIFVLGGEDELE